MTLTKNKYDIRRRYIRKGQARSGAKLDKVSFIVDHETANNSADAMDHFHYFNDHQPEASAHTFIDPDVILEIVPLDEKAWHVRYDKPTDNQLYGDDANDEAIGVELCRTGVFAESYDRYVWYNAYLCRKFNLDPKKDIVAHKVLDPERRRDPQSFLNPNGITWAEFILDVQRYYDEWHQPIGGSEHMSGDKYQIQSGDTFWGIANRFGIQLDDLISVNPDKDPEALPVGGWINLPAGSGENVGGRHQIQAGDTFWGLANRYEVKVSDLRAVNPNADEDRLQIGSWINIPAGGASDPVDEYEEPYPLPDGIYNTGSEGQAVYQIQTALAALYFYPNKGAKNNGIDGIYGANTKDAVKRFQSVYVPHEVDGIYGSTTKGAMEKELKRRGLK